MAGLFGGPPVADEHDLFESVDPVGLCALRRIDLEEPSMSLGFAGLPWAPLGGGDVHAGRLCAGILAGDLVGRDAVPWEGIVDDLLSGGRKTLQEMEGIWALALMDRQRNRLFLVTDRRNYHPLYLQSTPAGPRFSTSLATFCRWPGEIAFDPRWLWETLFIAHPVGETTFIKGVRRLPAATVTEIDLGGSGRQQSRTWADPIAFAGTRLSGREADERALQVFAERVPLYFETSGTPHCMLTGGWDSRTVLAHGLEHAPEAYTYGLAGSSDVRAARRVAAAVGVPHHWIPLAQEFEDNVAALMPETVYASGGLENPARASVYYSALTLAARRPPVILGGLSLDSTFRGHAAAPATMAEGICKIFGGGAEEEALAEVRALAVDPDASASAASEALAGLRPRHGDLSLGEAHLRFFVNDGDSGYFGGERALTDTCSTLRAPGWDTRIIELAFSIERNGARFSQFLAGARRGAYPEMILQSHLLCRGPAPQLGRIPVRRASPRAILLGKWAYKVDRTLRRAVNRGRRALGGGTPFGPSEDWNRWFKASDRYLDLQGGDARILQYIRRDAVQAASASGQRDLMKRLMQAEAVLRLLENRWKRFWPVPEPVARLSRAPARTPDVKVLPLSASG